jgi:hypothetical protein
MRWQDRGDVGGGISSEVEELRMDASSKGLAWLQKKVESMNQTELRKMAAAVALPTRGARSIVALGLGLGDPLAGIAIIRSPLDSSGPLD